MFFFLAKKTKSKKKRPHALKSTPDSDSKNFQVDSRLRLYNFENRLPTPRLRLVTFSRLPTHDSTLELLRFFKSRESASTPRSRPSLLKRQQLPKRVGAFYYMGLCPMIFGWKVAQRVYLILRKQSESYLRPSWKYLCWHIVHFSHF